ncbi:MFS transporter [Nocardia sp. NPDC057663]|uniref:MFS transporter n=1 Tax=Nocardia sp. NPDC057663 TaxID=3346201 RepID=UPI0036715637
MAARGPLRSRAFRWVWGGETVSMVGDASYEVVLALLVLSVTGSPAALGMVMLAVTVPHGALLLIGGAITDRFSPRTIMLIGHLVRGTLLAVLAVLAAADAVTLWHLLVIGIVIGTAEAFFHPASAGILPSLVSRADLPRANALLGAGEQAARLAGPVLGGLLMAVAGAPIAIGFNALTFLIGAVTVSAAPRREPEPVEQFSARAVLREITSGFAYARRSVEVRIILLLVGAATLSYSGLFGVGLPTLSQDFRNSSVVLGAMLSAWGLGQLAGTLSAATFGLPRRWGVLIVAMTIAEGCSFAVLGFVPHYLIAVVLLAVLGFGVAYSTDVALPTFVQTTAPETMLGRVNSLIDLPRAVLSPLSLAAFGFLAAAGVRWAFLAAAVPVLLVGIGLLLSGHAATLTSGSGPAADLDGTADPSIPRPT